MTPPCKRQAKVANPQKKRLRPLILLLVALGVLLSFGCSATPEPEPRSALQYFQAGNLALNRRDYSTSVWNYLRAISLNDETPEFYYNLGLAYYHIGNYPEAIDAFTSVEQLRPDHADTYYNMALAYHKLSRTDLADKYYNRYQDLLSIRKARQRLEQSKSGAQKAMSASNTPSQTKPLAKPTRRSTKKSASPTQPKAAFSNQVPKWD
ncbi:MAG TPA: tetratricopeptide repeat protein [Deltaproteobacteria bacterium]|jgi:small glutamine-rich tetratricopeptide repeat-containing protein alpha|nr:tetratricopeptide repeat protein [Candidatus Lambdaproteobacteria bacterium]HIL16690.1 tetratricopeptide repeat protein [Deltaproteobacteria bacterium]